MSHTEMLSFTKSILPFADTEQFDKLLLDYVNDSEQLNSFYHFDDSEKGIKERINTYVNPRLNRQNLKNNLLRQYTNGGIKEIPSKVHDNIVSLEHDKTYTVSTGHQLNIFSGPLYVFYKLIS